MLHVEQNPPASFVPPAAGPSVLPLSAKSCVELCSGNPRRIGDFRLACDGGSSMQGCVITTLAKATLLGAAIGLAISAQAIALSGSSTPRPVRSASPMSSPSIPRINRIMERLKKREVLEDLRDFLSLAAAAGAAPDQGRGAATATSMPRYSANVVTYCYELIEYIRKSAPKETTDEGITPEDAVLGAFVDIMLHEISHAIFDMLKIPVFGREEDAADQLAAFILLQFGKDAARRTLTGTAHFWGSMSVSQKLEHSDFADIHGVTRSVSTMCCASPTAPSATCSTISCRRGCSRKIAPQLAKSEYRQIVRAYVDLVAPHVDPDAQKKVQAMEWL